MRNRARCVVMGVVLAVFSFSFNALGQEKAGPVKPLPPEKLGAFLKDLSGWKADGPPEGDEVKTREGTYTEATRYYVQGDKELEIVLTDGANVPMAYSDYDDWKEEVGEEGPDIVKVVQIEGNPAVEVYEPDYETATLIVVVKKRLVLSMEMDEATEKDDLKPLAKQLDWKGIAALVP